MIAELAADLLARVQTIPALTDHSSITLGGQANDPTLEKLPLPSAWVSFAREIVDEQSYTHGPESGVVPSSQMMLAFFSVMAYLPYTTDADMVAVEYPLLEAIRLAVHAKPDDGGDSISGFKWRYAGQTEVRVRQNQVAYAQIYTVNYST